MPWIYKQSTGELSRNGVIITRNGYSGKGEGKNNPSLQAWRSVGPIPRGTYTIGSPRNSSHLGNYAMPLTPNTGTNTFGRDAFYIHGDSIRRPGTASEGCIILGPDIRARIWASGDRALQVVE
ncbi:tlde1 domain-containing protein [Trinickia sp. EG282A]|uniref:tlde1 domain-containing protein n=1 Tax=Trinickia sp. EG282A TaxID=3237013 RepID=UPI0034D1B8BD